MKFLLTSTICIGRALYADSRLVVCLMPPWIAFTSCDTRGPGKCKGAGFKRTFLSFCVAAMTVEIHRTK